MTQFMIYSLHPHALAIINPAALPVFGMYQMDTTVLESLPGSSAPINILEPLNVWPFNPIKATEA
jgi:hypothetical protein